MIDQYQKYHAAAIQELSAELPVMALPADNSMIWKQTEKAAEITLLVLQGMGITINETSRLKIERVMGDIIFKEI